VGDRLKRLDGHEYGTRSAKCSTFSAGRHGITDASLIKEREEKIMSKGKVKFFDTTKGFGFITQNQGEDLFFHVSELRAATANEGDQVEYEISEGKKGPCAVNIREAYSM
jgi:cold shock protein